MEDFYNFSLVTILKMGLKPADIYSICEFAIKMAKDEDGHYNRALFDIALIDAYILTMFPEVSGQIEGKDIFEACQWVQENGYLEKIDAKLYDAVKSYVESELWAIESYESASGVVLRDFMKMINKTFDNLSNKAELNIANEDVQSVLQIAEKYGMK